MRLALAYILRPGPVRHEAVQGDRDVEVLVAEDEPGRDRLPRRRVRRQPCGKGGLRDRALGRAHHRGLGGGCVGGELVVEGVGPDNELAAAGGDRIGVQCLAEGASGELAGQVERGLAVLGRERADVDEGGYLVTVGGGLGDHHAAIGVADQDHGCPDAGEHVPEVGGVTRNAAQRIGDGDRAYGLRLQLLDDAVPAGGFGEGAVHEDDGRFLLSHEFCLSVS
jgi:hypothetical protein